MRAGAVNMDEFDAYVLGFFIISILIAGTIWWVQIRPRKK